MKALLGCLLSLVLATAQTFAVGGGPDYGGGGQVRTTGIYSGVMRPGPLSPGANSIGLFSVSIPRAGLGTGTVIMFTTGQTYVGTFTGLADPDTAKLSGQIDASFPIVSSEIDSDGDLITTTFLAKAAGKLEGQIRQNSNVFSTSSARIIGEANVQYSIFVNTPFTQIGYIVSGFKQQEL